MIVPDRRRSSGIKNPRAFLVHGWAFRDYDEDTVAAIKRYLDDGDTTHLPDELRQSVERGAARYVE